MRITDNIRTSFLLGLVCVIFSLLYCVVASQCEDNDDEDIFLSMLAGIVGQMLSCWFIDRFFG